MYQLLFALLFIKPSLKRSDLPQQVARLTLGILIALPLFYFGNPDQSLSFIVSILWIPALLDLVSVIGQLADRKRSSKKPNYTIVILLGLAMFVVSIGYNLYPYITFGAKSLSEMVKVKESKDKVSKIDTAHIIVISPETAYYEMQKMLGSLPNPSVYKIGELGTTKTKDGACYVAPIEVDGDFKALSKGEIPGVMYVSAEKPEEAKVVNIPSKVADSLVFGKYLQRILRSYKPEVILFQANVELDDENNPYYVGSYGHYKYGRTGAVIDGVLLIAFKDGKVTDYSVDKVPAWVEEVYPSDIAEQYNTYFGTLGKGLFNKLISKDGVHVPTEWASDTTVNGLVVNSREVTGVIDADGKMKWFTDHTNTSETSTTMTRYSLMDMRTGDMIYYQTPGYINGKGAMNAVDKALGANKANWAPVQPLFYNIFGSEAWVVPVVNKADGALVKIAIVSAQDGYVVLEDNKDAAIEGFKNAIAYGKINNSTGKNAVTDKAEERTIEGKVDRINAVSENGNTVFYVKLVGQTSIFMITKTAGVDIVLTKESDEVIIKYLDIKDNIIYSATSIKNNSIK